MAEERRYASPAAFRRALTDRLRGLAETGLWSLSELQRHIAYDRLLERLYRSDDGWIVKGAAALLARGLAVRGTVDVDVYRAISRGEAEADLREAAQHDLGDWFRFEVGPGRPFSGGRPSVRLPVTAAIGGTVWCSFRVDLVAAGVRLTGSPERVPPIARVDMPAVAQRGYLVYPLVDHIADKVVATLQRYGPEGRPSTRYKDLVDLVAIVQRATVEAAAQRAAIHSEADRRQLILPITFGVTDDERWQSGYAFEAGRSLLATARTLDRALATVTPFTDPLLDGTASGTWDPSAGCWSEDVQNSPAPVAG